MVRGFACGVFDLYHPGHVYMLRDCKAQCDHLTVAINRAENFDYSVNPGKREPVFTPEERKLVIESIKYVDSVIFYDSEDELTRIMKTGNFDVRFLGDDYKGRKITAPEAIPDIKYIDRGHGYSTTTIFERIKERLENN
jgi:glycerol-3-phosphate cytidylyltransferase